MSTVFTLSGMQLGSRILTTIASLAWLPNLAVWAISWLFGAGFSIGSIASFTLWTGQSTSLPALPIFGMLPEPVANDGMRTILLALPLVIGIAAGLVLFFIPQGFSIHSHLFTHVPQDLRAMVRVLAPRFIYPAIAFGTSGIVASAILPLLFALSNGSLGTDRLCHGMVGRADCRVPGSRATLGAGTSGQERCSTRQSRFIRSHIQGG